MFEKVRDWVADNKAMLNQFIEEQNRAPGTSFKLDDHRYPSFSKDLLPYQYFDEESHLFLNETNAGLLYRIIPLTGGNEKLAEQLDVILRTKISDLFTMQMILVKHNQVAYDIDKFARQFSNKDFESLNNLGENLSDFYKDAARFGFKTNTALTPRLMHTECFLVVDCQKGSSESELKAKFGQLGSSLEAALRVAKIGFKKGTADELLSLIQFYLNHCPDTTSPVPVDYNKKRLLKNQILSFDFDMEVLRDGLLIKGKNANSKPFESSISVLTIDKLPERFHLWENINNTSNVFHPEQSIPCNHIISVVYKVDDALKAQDRANRKTRSFDKKAKSDYAVLVAGTEEQAKSWRAFRDDLHSQKTRAVKMLYNVILFSRSNDKTSDIEATTSAYLYNGIKLAIATRMQLPYFLVSMPFMFTKKLDKDFMLPTMMWPISSWNAVQYMPILSDWTGCERGVLLPTMREQYACIDPFSGVFGTNYNIAATGTSGGGKSFFIQMLMLNVLFNGGDIFIIDIGGSYRKLCESLGGVYLEYENLAMNPFTHVGDIHHEIDDLIAHFELLTCPSEGALDDDRGTLREAILLAFHKHKCETLVDHVQAALLSLYENDAQTYPTARILAKNLQPFCKDSEHGRVFNAPSKLSPDARFIVTDLKAIEDNKNIRKPTLLAIISQYQRRMFDSDRKKQKMCIIDEAWSFFTGDKIAADFITKGFRTGRRHNASFVTITQGIDDYYEFPEARAAWENSAMKLIFLQETAALAAHQKAHQTFSEMEVSLLNSFPKAKDAGFSQVLLKANGISSVHRLFVDSYTKVMLSSDGSDYQAVKDYLAKGIPFSRAIERVAKEHYGDRHAN